MRTPDTSFRISPAVGNNTVTITATNDRGGAAKGEIEIAFYSESRSRYLTGRFKAEADLAFTGASYPERQRVTIRAEVLAKGLTDSLGTSLSVSDFTNNELELKGVLFFRPEGAGDMDPRIRILGEIEVEITLESAGTASVSPGSGTGSASRLRRLPVATVAGRGSEVSLLR